MPSYLSPILNDQACDANGAPLSGGKVYAYAAGTSTPIATYTDADGLTPQSNPIILNTAGRPDYPIWLPAGQAVKLVLKTSAEVLVDDWDNVTGVGDPTNAAAVDQWVTFTGTPTYISATSFSVGGDQTGVFQVRRRLKTANTGGAVYSAVTAASYNPGSGLTTVTVANDSGSLDSGLSQVAYGLITPVNTSWPQLSILNVQRFTSTGTYTPTAGTRAVIVELVGGGGAGGGGAGNAASNYSAGSGGGAGGYAKSFLASGFSGVAVTVGAAGAAGAAGAVNGGAGGTSSFGALLSATGGSGGSGGASIAVAAVGDIQSGVGGAGGVGSGGNLVTADGAPGGASLYLTRPQGGSGGTSRFGGGGRGRTNEAAHGNAAVSYGAGGGGPGVPASDSAKSGGAGGAGVVIVYEFG